MTRLIKSGTYVEDAYARVADDAPLPDGAVIVSLARFQKEREALLARNTPVGIQLQSSEKKPARHSCKLGASSAINHRMTHRHNTKATNQCGN